MGESSGSLSDSKGKSSSLRTIPCNQANLVARALTLRVAGRMRRSVAAGVSERSHVPSAHRW